MTEIKTISVVVFSPYRRISFTLLFFFFNSWGCNLRLVLHLPLPEDVVAQARPLLCHRYLQHLCLMRLTAKHNRKVVNPTANPAIYHGNIIPNLPLNPSAVRISDMHWGSGEEESVSFQSWDMAAGDALWAACCPSSQEGFSNGISTVTAFGDLGQKCTVCSLRPWEPRPLGLTSNTLQPKSGFFYSS